jgi:hypothetical protein
MGGQPQKFDRLRMYELLKEVGPDGKKRTETEVARILGVGVSAISRASKDLRANVVKVSVMEVSHKILEKELNVVDQLHNINKHTKEILEDLILKIKQKPTTTLDVRGMKDLRALALDTAAEIRQQLNFQVEVFKTLADIKVMAEFQKEVLDVVGNANKCPACGEEIKCVKCGETIDLRGEIIKRLQASKALRASVKVKP